MIFKHIRPHPLPPHINQHTPLHPGQLKDPLQEKGGFHLKRLKEA